VPPNCTFEVDDITQEWTWPEDHFDFIHIREMFGSVPDWDGFFEQCFKHTARGGWIEIVEHAVEPTCDDDTQPPDHFYWQWGAKVVECGERIGKSFTIWREAKERLERAGFVDVTEVTYKWPMNAWSNDVKSREIGRWNQLRLFNGIEGFMLRLLTGPGDVRFLNSENRPNFNRCRLKKRSCFCRRCDPACAIILAIHIFQEQWYMLESLELYHRVEGFDSGYFSLSFNWNYGFWRLVYSLTVSL
jgi:Methyltransferase domain